MNNVDVAVWLGIKGGKDAEREFQQFGRAGKTSLNEVRAAARDLPPSLIAVSRSVMEVRRSAEAATGGLGRVASSFGVAGLAAAGGAVAIGLAAKATYDMTRGAMVMAGSIGDAAERAKVTTDTLQALRYAIQQSGGQFEDADEAIVSFRTQLGAAEGGAKRALESFQRLGFSKEQLKSFDTYDAALAAVADRIAALPDNEQFFAASKVGLEKLLPLISKGGAEMARLQQEAHDLGFVMDADLVKKLGQANTEFDALSHIIDVQFKSAFVSLAPVLLQTMRLIGEVAKAVNEVADAFQKLEDRSTASLRRGIAAASQKIDDAKTLKGPIPEALRDAIIKRQVEKLGKLNDQLRITSGAEAPAGGPKQDGALIDLDAQKDAAAAAKKAAQQLDRFKTADATAAMGLLAEYAKALSLTVEERYDLERDMLLLEKQSREAELDRMAKDGDITAAQAAALKLSEEKVRLGKEANSREAERREVQDRQLQQEKALADINDQLLSLALAGARTQAERRDLELRALEARRAVERHALEVSLDRDRSLSDADRAQRLGGFDAATSGQRQDVRRNTRGPLEDYRDTFLRTTAEIDEALQAVAADGMAALSDGLVNVITQAKSLGDVFQGVADQIVSGLARIAIQQAIIAPLANALFGAGGGALGNILGSFLGRGLGGSSSYGIGAPTGLSYSGGRASGGPVYRGDWRAVGELGMERLAATSDGYVHDHMATARQMDGPAGGAGGGSGGPIAVTLNNRSGAQLGATARETKSQTGGRALDIDLFDMVHSIADQRVREMTQGGRDDPALGRRFGLRPKLSGA